MAGGRLLGLRPCLQAVRGLRSCALHGVDPRCYVGKVTVLGATSPLGQVLSLLVKRLPNVRDLAMHDSSTVVGGVCLELSHMNTRCRVKSYTGPGGLRHALQNSDLVVITDGWGLFLRHSGPECLRKVGPTLMDYASKVALYCPEAVVCIATPPVNSQVPLFLEGMRAGKAYNPNKVVGVCSLYEARTSCVVAEYLGLDPSFVHVPMVGGLSFHTSLPLLSSARPFKDFTRDEVSYLTGILADMSKEARLMRTDSHLSAAAAIVKLIRVLAEGMRGCSTAVATAYVRSNILPQVTYLATRLRFGPDGVEANFGLPRMWDQELRTLEHCLPVLQDDIDMGVALARQLAAEGCSNDVSLREASLAVPPAPRPPPRRVIPAPEAYEDVCLPLKRGSCSDHCS